MGEVIMSNVKVDRWIVRYPDGESLSVYTQAIAIDKLAAGPAGTEINYRPVIRHANGDRTYPLGH